MIEVPGSKKAERAIEEESGSRLATSQLRRLRRIVDAAKQLATEGGLDGVRLRTVAEVAEVALGTLYRYFESKEDILVFALAEEIAGFEKRMRAHPPEGETPRQRVGAFFAISTQAFTQRREKFARACLQAFASGGAKNVDLVAGIRLRWIALILSAIEGREVAPQELSVGSEVSRDQSLASILENVWVVGLIGWAGGIQTHQTVVEQVNRAAALLLPA